MFVRDVAIPVGRFVGVVATLIGSALWVQTSMNQLARDIERKYDQLGREMALRSLTVDNQLVSLTSAQARVETKLDDSMNDQWTQSEQSTFEQLLQAQNPELNVPAVGRE